MNGWIKKNWDKLLLLPIAGVVGYFSAIFLLGDDITDLRERVKAAETKIEYVLNPSLEKIQGKIDIIDELEGEMKSLKKENNSMALTMKNFDIYTEQWRAETIKELRIILENEKK